MKWLASVGVLSALFNLASATNEKLLVLLSDSHGKEDYSKLESYLNGKYGRVRFASADAKKAPKLFVEGQSAYNHLIILSSNPPCTKLLYESTC